MLSISQPGVPPEMVASGFSSKRGMPVPADVALTVLRSWASPPASEMNTWKS